jgi:hypothetical protein
MQNRNRNRNGKTEAIRLPVRIVDMINDMAVMMQKDRQEVISMIVSDYLVSKQERIALKNIPL